MTTGILIALIMVFVAFIALAMVLLTDVVCNTPEYKKFFIGTTVVYFTGTLFVLTITLIQKLIPWNFVVISEVCMIVIYVFCTYMIKRLIKNFKDLSSEIEKKNITKVEDEKEDEEDY